MVTSSRRFSQTLEKFLREVVQIPIGEKQAQTFMLVFLIKTLLTSNRNVGTTSIPRTRRINQSQILAPTVYENIPSALKYVKIT